MRILFKRRIVSLIPPKVIILKASRRIKSLEVTKDLIIGGSGRVYIRKDRTDTIYKELQGLKGIINDVVFYGGRIITASDDRKVCIRTLNSQLPYKCFELESPVDRVRKVGDHIIAILRNGAVVDIKNDEIRTLTYLDSRKYVHLETFPNGFATSSYNKVILRHNFKPFRVIDVNGCVNQILYRRGYLFIVYANKIGVYNTQGDRIYTISSSFKHIKYIDYRKNILALLTNRGLALFEFYPPFIRHFITAIERVKGKIVKLSPELEYAAILSDGVIKLVSIKFVETYIEYSMDVKLYNDRRRALNVDDVVRFIRDPIGILEEAEAEGYTQDLLKYLERNGVIFRENNAYVCPIFPKGVEPEYISEEELEKVLFYATLEALKKIDNELARIFFFVDHKTRTRMMKRLLMRVLEAYKELI